MAGIQRYFSRPPQPITTSNPYTISILNIVRYKLA
jgi:hypothetical protein